MTKKEKEILFNMYAERNREFDIWTRKCTDIINGCKDRDATEQESDSFEYYYHFWEYWRDICSELDEVICNLGCDLSEFEQRYHKMHEVS